MISKKDVKKVMDIWNSNEKSLKSLAEMSGMDVFSFYQGADLRSLDLQSQDLTEMNFDGADLRFSDLTGAMYDAGAFNGSTIDDGQEWLTDEYEFYAHDVYTHPIDQILVFCRFRPGVVDNAMRYLSINFVSFSELSSVSATALRKARKGEVVALETANRILSSIDDLHDDYASNIDTRIRYILTQPVIQFLSGGINMPFVNVSRGRLQNLWKMRNEIISIRNMMYGERPDNTWRDTPEFIERMLEWYRTDRDRMFDLSRNSQ